jgi:hypothetical protein
VQRAFAVLSFVLTIGARALAEQVRERDARCAGAALVLARRAFRIESVRGRRGELIDELSHRRIPVVQVTAEELPG